MAVFSFSWTNNPQQEVTVVSSASVMGGQPVVVGTRVPANTIIAYLRDGFSESEITEDYPSLPAGAVQAVRIWAEENYGLDWQSLPEAGRLPTRSGF